MPTVPSRALTARIEAPYDAAYARLSDPSTWPDWAAGMGSGLTPGADGLWTVNTAKGEPAHVRFTAPNPYGVLDHTVILPGGDEVHMPFRLIRNGDGCEIIMTLLRLPDMDDAAFAHDAGLIENDLAALKASLEA